ncbi:MAG: DISARM system SNF2-like helicase DrmD [Polyangiales bacterium]
MTTTQSNTNVPSTRSVLRTLSSQRVMELARELDVLVPLKLARELQADWLAESPKMPFRKLLSMLTRDELRAACAQHGIDGAGRSRAQLAERLLQAHGAMDSLRPKAMFEASALARDVPRAGDIVQVRHRQWLVEAVHAPPQEGHATRVSLVCLDDDNQGQPLEVLWELELGARVHQPAAHGLGTPSRIDPPRHFAAYLHAIGWSSVTATDAKLFQSPFRAGIKLMAHQLAPLRKALSLPRANVFIADDVGLGKTIEAGLIAQELLLRQRVEFVLIVCPASVCLQWRDEMQKKFGLRFEVMTRAFIAQRRQERGFSVNPWSTHTRFIVSYPILRRPEYRDALLAHLGERARKSLLILDEAHVAAPASAQKYAVDSKITDVVRDIAPRFENRLFLSATPHNGHSNSFSALLELLDPQRFTRGVPVKGRAQLEAVMVRRLKEDLRQLGVEQFPKRTLVKHTVAGAIEEDLSQQLAEYTRIMNPGRARGRLVFINLQKRLLSSVEAFYRTLSAHAESVERGAGGAKSDDVSSEPLLAQSAGDEDEVYGADDDGVDAREQSAVSEASRRIAPPGERAKSLLESMLATARRHRGAPDAKVQTLIAWMREHQCKAAQIGGADAKASKRDRAWSDRRVILFTEYGDTKRYLQGILRAAIEGTERADERIMVFHGGMSDEQREEVQRAFNAPPDEHPVRVLIATDAAREGVNLQGHCADLFHFDVPWNPARMEQRNGRIDRTLQPAKEVFCHYFHYPARREDLVLEKLIEKVDVIQRDLGSMSAVLLERMGAVMESGIDDETLSLLERAEQAGERRKTASEELEANRPELDRLRAEIEEASALLERSKGVINFDPALLRDAIDVGLELSGASALKPLGDERYELPTLAASWQDTVDTLRPPRGRDEPLWEFRKKKPWPIVFRPPPKMNSAQAHVHLEHPLVQRVLGRFLSQGYSAHDLSRVTVVRTRHDSLVRVIAFGRLSLFGAGATRLHDQLVRVAARWIEGREQQELKPFADEADRKAIEMLEQVLAEAPTLEAASESLQARVREAAPRLFSALWTHVQAEADARAVEAEQQLARRGTEEAQALSEILKTQRRAIIDAIEARSQLSLGFFADEREGEQFEREKQWLDDRLVSIQQEVQREPDEIRALYRVALRRLEPVGLVVLWPETRG